jgi:hypothetical protein
LAIGLYDDIDPQDKCMFYLKNDALPFLISSQIFFYPCVGSRIPAKGVARKGQTDFDTSEEFGSGTLDSIIVSVADLQVKGERVQFQQRLREKEILINVCLAERDFL